MPTHSLTRVLDLAGESESYNLVLWSLGDDCAPQELNILKRTAATASYQLTLTVADISNASLAVFAVIQCH